MREPVGWKRWRRPLPGQTGEQLIVSAQENYGIFHLAEYSLLLRVKRKDVPLAIDSRQHILATYGLLAQR